MLLAALAMGGEASIHRANAKKNLMVVALSVAGSIVFLPSGEVVWLYAAPILIASGIGGYGAVYLVRRVPQHVLRLSVLAWAIVLTGVMFWKYG
ncbi:MAG: sulfite exporter TauE/SafE family protein [Rhodoferax sp.]|nr:sulfite exporter TauE/SafE family protein [Rhodoferax sp.]